MAVHLSHQASKSCTSGHVLDHGDGSLLLVGHQPLLGNVHDVLKFELNTLEDAAKSNKLRLVEFLGGSSWATLSFSWSRSLPPLQATAELSLDDERERSASSAKLEEDRHSLALKDNRCRVWIGDGGKNGLTELFWTLADSGELSGLLTMLVDKVQFMYIFGCAFSSLFLALTSHCLYQPRIHRYQYCFLTSKIQFDVLQYVQDEVQRPFASFAGSSGMVDELTELAGINGLAGIVAPLGH